MQGFKLNCLGQWRRRRFGCGPHASGTRGNLGRLFPGTLVVLDRQQEAIGLITELVSISADLDGAEG